MNDLEAWAEKMFPSDPVPDKGKKHMFKTYQTKVKDLDIYFLALDERHARAIAAHLRGSVSLLMSRLYSE